MMDEGCSLPIEASFTDLVTLTLLQRDINSNINIHVLIKCFFFNCKKFGCQTASTQLGSDKYAA
jgi:hypothetical protein